MTRRVSLLLLAVLAVFLVGVPGGVCKDVYVNSSATEGPDGSQDKPYPDMSSAIENASTGDRILVASGTYEGENNRDLSLNFSLEIRALDFSDPRPVFNLESKGTFATFDPEQTAPNGASSSALIGLEFQEGSGSGDSGSVLTIMSGSINIGGCVFQSNAGDEAGAVVVTSSENPSSVPNLVMFAQCTFHKNTGARGAAASILPRNSRTVAFGGCSFTENTAENNGGAIYTSDSSLVIVESNFSSNVATDGFGGAISAESTQESIQVKVYSSRFTKNDAAEQGGGIHFDGGVLILSKSTFLENFLHDGSEPALRQGAGVFVLGSAIVEGCSFSSNTCSSGTSHGGGIVVDGDQSSWISNTTFEGNLGFFGSDVAVLSGTSAFFSQVTFGRTEEEGMYQIYSSGQTLFENCDFKQGSGEVGEQALLSAYVSGAGAIDFEWSTGSVDFYIESVTLLNQGALKTSSNLNISVCVMSGGLLLSTSTATRQTLAILESMLVAPNPGSDLLGTAGFDVVNYGTFTLSAGCTFGAQLGRGTFTNQGEAILGDASGITGVDLFANNGVLTVDKRAAINSEFHNSAGGSISLNGVTDSNTAALVIGGPAVLDGTLEVNLDSAGENSLKKTHTPIPLLTYTSLKGLFKDYDVSPTVSKARLWYDPFVLYLANQKNPSSSGFGGGDIALTVSGAAILGAAVWYFWIRNPQQESFAVLGGGNDI